VKVQHTNSVSNSMMNSYLEQRMDVKERKEFESILSVDESALKLFNEKKAIHEFFLDLIPDEKLTKKARYLLEEEIKDINESLLKEYPKTLGGKLYAFLTKTVIEF